MTAKAYRITIKDIAQLAGVSQPTVSQVLNRKANSGISAETAKRVFKAATKLGYLQPTESGTSKTEQRFAIVVPNIINPHFANLLSHLSVHAYERKLQMLVCNTQTSPACEREHVGRLLANGIEGILYVCTPTCMDLIEKQRPGLPVVIVGETTENLNVPVISTDNNLGGRIIMEHLYELGHRKIAYVTPPINSVSVLRQQRLDGMVEYLREKKAEKHFYVYEQTSYVTGAGGSFEVAMGELQTEKILSDNRDVTAIVAQGDMIALGVYSVLKREGFGIPENISVAAFDNTEYGRHITPALTSLESQIIMRGTYGFEQLFRLMTNSGDSDMPPPHINYRPSLVVRASTAKAPGQGRKTKAPSPAPSGASD